MIAKIWQWLTTQTVLVLIGGHGQRLLPWVHLLFPFVRHVIVVDNEHDVNRLPQPSGALRVQLFALGVGHTALSLLKGLSPQITDYIKSVGGMSASGGMGQCTLMGREAGRQLVESADFQRFVKQKLVPEIRARAGGDIRGVRFLVLGSLAGGTYSGAEIPVANGAAQLVHQLTGAIVTIEYLATGGLTYEGLGERIWPNTAASLAEMVADATAPDRHPFIIHRVRLLELPVFGRNEQLRDATLATIEQGARSASIAYEQEQGAPNNAFDGPLGNFQIWEAAFGKQLQLPDDIVPAVASAYLPPLTAVLHRRPSETEAERLELRDNRTPLATTTVEDILATAVERPVESSLVELTTPAHRHDVEVRLHWDRNSWHRIADLPQLWTRPAATVDELDKRLQVLRRSQQLLQTEALSLTERRALAEASLSEADDRYRRMHKLLNPQGLVAYCRAAASSTASKLERLETAAYAIRARTDELALIMAEQAAIDRCLALVAKELDYVVRRLTKVIKALQAAGPELGVAPPKVIPRPLDEQLEKLWEVCDLPPAALMDAIRESVKAVTLSGLAAVTGSAADRVEAVAQQIVSGNCYVTPAVPWGGQRRASGGRTVHLLPPVEPWLRKEVLNSVAKRDATIEIYFVEATVVINVMAVTMRKVESIDDLFTAPLRSALEEVRNSPCPELYLRGLETLQQIGLELPT